MRPRPRTTHHCRLTAIRRLSLWPLFVAVFTLTSQLFALGHLVLFRHARCEHGEVVHVGGAQQWRAETRQIEVVKSGTAVVAGSERDAEHDHCDALATPPALARLKPLGVGASLSGIQSDAELDAREGARSVAILFLAPKTSPTA
jgi:hypothetical protein